MQHFKTHWTAADGLNLYAQGWQPDGPLKGAVCLVHGLGDHSNRYGHVAEAFGEAGYALSAFDLRGHGQSGGPRGHSPSFEAILNDIGLLLSETARRYPGVPTVLYGHSLGGSLVLNYALRRKPAIAGVIATSPGLRPFVQPPGLKLAVGRAARTLAPAFSMANGLEVLAISRDAEVVSRYMKDPLVHDRVSAQLGLDILETGEWALAHAAEFPLPLLLTHGDADRLTSAAASREFAAKAGPRCTLKIWPGGYHEIHNDPDRDQFLAYLAAWLDMTLTR